MSTLYQESLSYRLSRANDAEAQREIMWLEIGCVDWLMSRVRHVKTGGDERVHL